MATGQLVLPAIERDREVEAIAGDLLLREPVIQLFDRSHLIEALFLAVALIVVIWVAAANRSRTSAVSRGWRYLGLVTNAALAGAAAVSGWFVRDAFGRDIARSVLDRVSPDTLVSFPWWGTITAANVSWWSLIGLACLVAWLARAHSGLFLSRARIRLQSAASDLHTRV